MPDLAGQAIAIGADVRDVASGRILAKNSADQTIKRLCSGPATAFFSAADRPGLPFSFGFGVDRGHAHDGGDHNRRAEISIANQTNRFLRVAAQYVHHVGQGVFPRADTR